MPLIRNIPYTDVPVAYSLEYADQAARLADSGLVAADRGRIARQADSGDYYILQVVSPVTWALLGIPASVGSYTHTQASASTVWTINHNLGFYPNIQARSAGGLAINGRLQHVSVNQATITFLTALTGTARAN